MTTIEKSALPRRRPIHKRTDADSIAVERAFEIWFSFNNTVDPDWTPDPGTEPVSRKERRIARTAAAAGRARQGRAGTPSDG